MKILLAVDGSACSDAAVAAVARRPWPAGSEIKLLFAVHSTVPYIPDPFLLHAAASMDSIAQQRQAADAVLERAAAALRAGSGTRDVPVTCLTVEGSPKEAIVDEAARWGADLIVVGSHGRGVVKRFLLGSVSHAVVLHAPCAVEVVRERVR